MMHSADTQGNMRRLLNQRTLPSEVRFLLRKLVLCSARAALTLHPVYIQLIVLYYMFRCPFTMLMNNKETFRNLQYAYMLEVSVGLCSKRHKDKITCASLQLSYSCNSLKPNKAQL
jgi:hypothetical protein